MSEVLNKYQQKYYSENKKARKKQTTRCLTRKKFINRGIDLSKKICEVNGCNKHGVIHHWNYEEKMDITFLCKEHHLQVHKGIKLDIFRHF